LERSLYSPVTDSQSSAALNFQASIAQFIHWLGSPNHSDQPSKFDKILPSYSLLRSAGLRQVLLSDSESVLASILIDGLPMLVDFSVEKSSKRRAVWKWLRNLPRSGKEVVVASGCRMRVNNDLAIFECVGAILALSAPLALLRVVLSAVFLLGTRIGSTDGNSDGSLRLPPRRHHL